MSAEELEAPVMTSNVSPDASIAQKLFKKLRYVSFKVLVSFTLTDVPRAINVYLLSLM
jgi:hypothetical protein